MSGYVGGTDVAGSIRVADQLLPKPFTPGDLIGRVHRALSLSAASRTR